jgi:hypothetical protein
LVRKHLYAFKQELETLKKSQLNKARRKKEEAKGSFQGQPDHCSIPVGRVNEYIPAMQQTSVPNAQQVDSPATQQTIIPNM